MGFAAAIASQAVSDTLTAIGQVSEGMNRSANYENQARAAEANSRLAAMNASITDSQGRIASAQTALDWHKRIGRQRAAMAQGGVLESPTGLLVREEAETRAKGDLFQVQLQSDLKKQSLEFQSADLLSQAKVARSNARYALFSGYLGAAGTFAGGASKAYGLAGQG